MSEQQEKFLEEYDKRYERMRNTLFGIISIIRVALLGSWFLIGKSQGKMEANLETITVKLSFISGDYTPAWYMSDMTKLFNLHTEKVVATLNNANTEEIRRIDNDFNNTIRIMQDQFIRLRGGMTQTTRSLNARDAEKGSSE